MPEKQLETAGAEAGDTATLDAPTDAPTWTPDAEQELKKIPFFVRGKVKRNTERFAQARGDREITVETLYDAKAHYSA
ncbi:hypothetical protein CKO21_16535 [Rhodovibrio salinarum]|uniref:Light-independent protochlorophyllide reductase subunit B-like C-terminal domain-containing protein n=1 Tax=Rhodovibrio salinarum TaxID=1087 RepID=A0A934QLD5_9PROT|nr:hypothetical protein [Rhodovibrio salinarum]